MFDLGLKKVTGETDTVLGRHVVKTTVRFECGCSISGYEHDGFRAYDSYSCYRHGTNGSDAVDATGFPVLGETEGTYSGGWNAGYDTGFYVGRKVENGRWADATAPERVQATEPAGV